MEILEQSPSHGVNMISIQKYIKGHNSKEDGFMALILCIPSDDALYLFKVS